MRENIVVSIIQDTKENPNLHSSTNVVCVSAAKQSIESKKEINKQETIFGSRSKNIQSDKVDSGQKKHYEVEEGRPYGHRKSKRRAREKRQASRMEPKKEPNGKSGGQRRNRKRKPDYIQETQNPHYPSKILPLLIHSPTHSHSSNPPSPYGFHSCPG